MVSKNLTRLQKIAEKKFVSYGIIVLGIARLTFSRVMHSVHAIEIVEALFLMSAGVVLHATHVHKTLLPLFHSIYKNVELTIDNVTNYYIPNIVKRSSQYFRKTHAGILSFNMLVMYIAILVLIIMLAFFSGHILN